MGYQASLQNLQLGVARPLLELFSLMVQSNCSLCLLINWMVKFDRLDLITENVISGDFSGQFNENASAPVADVPGRERL